MDGFLLLCYLYYILLLFASFGLKKIDLIVLCDPYIVSIAITLLVLLCIYQERYVIKPFHKVFESWGEWNMDGFFPLVLSLLHFIVVGIVWVEENWLNSTVWPIYCVHCNNAPYIAVHLPGKIYNQKILHSFRI